MTNPTYDKLLQLAHASLLEKAQVAVGETDLNVFWFIAEVGGINAEVAVAQQVLNALWPEIQDLLRSEFNRGFAGGEQSWAESHRKNPDPWHCGNCGKECDGYCQ